MSLFPADAKRTPDGLRLPYGFDSTEEMMESMESWYDDKVSWGHDGLVGNIDPVPHHLTPQQREENLMLMGYTFLLLLKTLHENADPRSNELLAALDTVLLWDRG